MISAGGLRPVCSFLELTFTKTVLGESSARSSTFLETRVSYSGEKTWHDSELRVQAVEVGSKSQLLNDARS